MSSLKGFAASGPQRKRLRFAAAFVLAGIVSTSTSSVAQAQEPPTQPPPTPPAADDPKSVEARQQFDAGVALLDDPDGARYEQAYHAFKRAYELSQSPKVLGNIGFCAMKLERDGEAIDTYTQYLREVPDIDKREKTQIQRDLATLTSTIGRMEVTVKHDPGKFTLVDHRNQARGEPIENGYAFDGNKLSIRLRPGRHTMKITVNGTEDSLPFDVTIEPGGSASHEFTFAPPVSPDDDRRARKPGSLVGPIITGAIGIAGIGTGVVFGVLARNKTNTIENNCPNNQCPATYPLATNRTHAKTFGSVADISFIAGGVVTAGALVWLVLTPGAFESRSRKTGSASGVGSWLSATSAMCTSDGCNVALKRGF